MLDYTALHNELVNDPMHLGYAAHVAAGQDQDCANLLNALTGPGAATVSLPGAPAFAVLDALASQINHLKSDIYANVAAAQPFKPVLDLLFSPQIQDIDFTNAWLQGEFSNLITAGYLTQADVTSVTARTGSRAEALFGSGTLVGHLDVAKALGRG